MGCGSSSSANEVDPTHGTPVAGKECGICSSVINASNYVEYKTHETSKWCAAGVCFTCFKQLQDTKWKEFEQLVEKADCRAAVLRLCRAVPLYVKDRITLPCPDHKEADSCTTFEEVSIAWAMSTNTKFAPILKGAKQGKERDDYIQHLKQFAELMEQEKEAENKEKDVGSKKKDAKENKDSKDAKDSKDTKKDKKDVKKK